MEERKSPAEFLEDFGIEMQKTTLVCYIDQVMKQPSLSYLMNEYANYVLKLHLEEKSE
jgi:hypothetical protein